MKSLVYLIAGALAAGTALAKLPPAPPVDPAKAEEAKQKAAEAAKKGVELQAKYEDKAVANYAAKAKAEGKAFKPALALRPIKASLAERPAAFARTTMACRPPLAKNACTP